MRSEDQLIPAKRTGAREQPAWTMPGLGRGGSEAASPTVKITCRALHSVTGAAQDEPAVRANLERHRMLTARLT